MEKKKNQGVSLVGVMIAAGLIGGLSLTVTHIVKQIMRGKKEAERIQNQFQLQKAVTFLLADEEHCTASLAGDDPSNPFTFKKADIDDPSRGRDVELFASDRNGTVRDGDAKFAPGKKFGKWIITSVKFYLDAGTGVHTPNQDNRDSGAVMVGIKKKIKEREHHRSLRFPLRVKVSTSGGPDPTSTLLECKSPFSPASGLSNVLQISEGILVNGGVRVGEAPSLACDSDQQGAIRFDSSSNNRLQYCDGTAWRPMGVPSSISRSSTGMEVNGSIKIGTSMAVCSSSNKGTIRYNNLANEVEFCNATQWTTL